MIQIRSDKARRYLDEHFDELASGARHWANLISFEGGDTVARIIPTNIADNFGRRNVANEIDRRLEDFLAHLETQRHGPQ